MPEPRTFVLVHGAWHGGWCWRDVVRILADRGHRVTAPTLTGLGERAHLLTPAIDLDTFVADVEQHLEFEDLADVILVGHSFAGHVVSLVADRGLARLRSLVFLDAFLPRDGCSAMDLLPRSIAAERLRAAEESSGGLTLPPPRAALLGLKNPALETLVTKRMRPHPLATYQSTVSLSAPLGNGLPCDFVSCRAPAFASIDPSLRYARELGWPVHDLAYGHDVMLEAPRPTADLLERLAR